ncbi:hypothetical protein ACQP3C_31030, partial [Escherichia coli]
VIQAGAICLGLDMTLVSQVLLNSHGKPIVLSAVCQKLLQAQKVASNLQSTLKAFMPSHYWI